MKMKKEDLLLYAVFGRNEKVEDSLKKIKEGLKGGITFFQLREKNRKDEEILSVAGEIMALCKQYEVPFIVNDRIDIANQIGAAGVHLGRDDGDIESARKILGEKAIIGATAHNLEEALEAEATGADYIGVGAAFGSTTKKDAKKIELAEYDRITGVVNIPVVAIGGIDIRNVEFLYGRGLSGVAISSGLFEHNDVLEATKRFKKKLKEEFY